MTIDQVVFAGTWMFLATLSLRFGVAAILLVLAAEMWRLRPLDTTGLAYAFGAAMGCTGLAIFFYAAADIELLATGTNYLRVFGFLVWLPMLASVRLLWLAMVQVRLQRIKETQHD